MFLSCIRPYSLNLPSMPSCVSQTNNNPWLRRGEGKTESQQHKSSSNKVWTGRRFAPSVLTPPKHTQSSFSRKACTMWIETQRRYYRICAWLSFFKKLYICLSNHSFYTGCELKKVSRAENEKWKKISLKLKMKRREFNAFFSSP